MFNPCSRLRRCLSFRAPHMDCSLSRTGADPIFTSVFVSEPNWYTMKSFYMSEMLS